MSPLSPEQIVAHLADVPRHVREVSDGTGEPLRRGRNGSWWWYQPASGNWHEVADVDYWSARFGPFYLPAEMEES